MILTKRGISLNLIANFKFLQTRSKKLNKMLSICNKKLKNLNLRCKNQAFNTKKIWMIYKKNRKTCNQNSKNK